MFITETTINLKMYTMFSHIPSKHTIQVKFIAKHSIEHKPLSVDFYLRNYKYEI